MTLGPHAVFILAAWVVAAGMIAILIAWVTLDYRRQLRILADLEQRGVTRRSAAATSAAPAEEPA
jgi:heme exporter protein D